MEFPIAVITIFNAFHAIELKSTQCEWTNSTFIGILSLETVVILTTPVDVICYVCNNDTI